MININKGRNFDDLDDIDEPLDEEMIEDSIYRNYNENELSEKFGEFKRRRK